MKLVPVKVDFEPYLLACLQDPPGIFILEYAFLAKHVSVEFNELNEQAAADGATKALSLTLWSLRAYMYTAHS